MCAFEILIRSYQYIRKINTCPVSDSFVIVMINAGLASVVAASSILQRSSIDELQRNIISLNLIYINKYI